MPVFDQETKHLEDWLYKHNEDNPIQARMFM